MVSKMLETGPGSHTARLPRLVAKTLLFTLNPVGPHVQRQGGLFTDNHVPTRTTTTGMHVDYGWGSRKVLPVRGVTVVPGHAVAATFGAGARRSTATLKTLKAAIEAREVRHRARSLHINLNLFARVFSRRGPKLLKDVVSKVPWTGHSSSVGLCRPMAVITAVNKLVSGSACILAAAAAFDISARATMKIMYRVCLLCRRHASLSCVTSSSAGSTFAALLHTEMFAKRVGPHYLGLTLTGKNRPKIGCENARNAHFQNPFLPHDSERVVLRMYQRCVWHTGQHERRV